MRRLEGRLGVHQRGGEADFAEQADGLSFDTSPEGERLPRHALSSGRALYRALDTLIKVRKSLSSGRNGDCAFDVASDRAVDLRPAREAQIAQNEPEPEALLPDCVIAPA